MVWLIEVLIITGVPLFMLLGMDDMPYSERLGKWYPKYTLDDDFSTSMSPNRLLEQIMISPSNALRALGAGDPRKFFRVHVFLLPDVQDQYMTVERVYIQDLERGNEESESVIANLRLSTADAQALLDDFRHTKRSSLLP